MLPRRISRKGLFIFVGASYQAGLQRSVTMTNVPDPRRTSQFCPFPQSYQEAVFPSSDSALGPRFWSWPLGKACTVPAIFFYSYNACNTCSFMITQQTEISERRKQNCPWLEITTVNIQCESLQNVFYQYVCKCTPHSFPSRDLTGIPFYNPSFILMIYHKQLSKSINMAKRLSPSKDYFQYKKILYIS